MTPSLSYLTWASVMLRQGVLVLVITVRSQGLEKVTVLIVDWPQRLSPNNIQAPWYICHWDWINTPLTPLQFIHQDFTLTCNWCYADSTEFLDHWYNGGNGGTRMYHVPPQPPLHHWNGAKRPLLLFLVTNLEVVPPAHSRHATTSAIRCVCHAGHAHCSS